MKKIFLLLIIICSLFIINCVNAQRYYPFPTKNAIWSIYYQQNQPPSQEYYSYGIIGDTIMNSLNYHKVYLLGDSTLNIKNSRYFGALREDSIKRVFFKRKMCVNEVILYNFSKKVNDTINIPFDYYGVCNYKKVNDFGADTVARIDSTLLLNHEYRKQINITPMGGNWVEGTGDINNGVFWPISDILNCDCSYNLICFIQDDTILYKNSKFKKCFNIGTGIKENNHKQNNLIIKIYPNPITSLSIIEIKGNYKNSYIEIYNDLGQEIEKINTDRKQKINLNRSNFKPGIYYIRLNTIERYNINNKFIVY